MNFSKTIIIIRRFFTKSIIQQENKSSIISNKMANKKLKISKIRNNQLKTNGRDHLPLPTGKFTKIGCRDLMVGLSRRSGILVRLYYPAKFDPKKEQELNPLLWPNWFPHEFYLQGSMDVVKGTTNSKILTSLIYKTRKSNVFIPAIPNAKLHMLPVDEKYPVVIFSHGLGGCRTVYSTLCCELASHGFVVAALEHRENSACLSFYPKRATYSFKSSNPDFFNIPVDEVDADDETDFGDELDDPNYIPPKALTALTNLPHLQLEWIRYRPVSLIRTDDNHLAFRKKQITQRVRECTRALDLIEALNAGYEINNLLDPGYNFREFENMLDMNKITMMGHSFGGATALMAGAAELRFKVIVALDPWMFPLKNESLDMIPHPTIMIFTDNLARAPNTNAVIPWIQENNNSNEDENYRKAIVIKGSNHLEQTDFPFVFNCFKWIPKFNLFNRINPLMAHDLTVYSSIQFIAQHLDIPIDDRINQYVDEEKKRLRPLVS